MRALTYVLALVATPLLYGLAFPPWRLAALAWIALAPWLVALRLASTTTRAVLIAGVTTLAASAVVAGWLPATPPDTVPPFALVWLVTVAPAVVLFTLCYRAAAARRDASIAFVAAAAWTGAEFARVELGVGVPFALLGYSQVPFPALVQIADVTGVYGIRPNSFTTPDFLLGSPSLSDGGWACLVNGQIIWNGSRSAAVRSGCGACSTSSA